MCDWHRVSMSRHLVKLVQPCIHPSAQHANLLLLLGINRLVAADEVEEGLWRDMGAPPEPAVVRDAGLADALLYRRHRVVEVSLSKLDIGDVSANGKKPNKPK